MFILLRKSSVRKGTSDGATLFFLAAHLRKELCLRDLQKKMRSLYPFVRKEFTSVFFFSFSLSPPFPRVNRLLRKELVKVSFHKSFLLYRVLFFCLFFLSDLGITVLQPLLKVLVMFLLTERLGRGGEGGGGWQRVHYSALPPNSSGVKTTAIKPQIVETREGNDIISALSHFVRWLATAANGPVFKLEGQ